MLGVLRCQNGDLNGRFIMNSGPHMAPCPETLNHRSPGQGRDTSLNQTCTHDWTGSRPVPHRRKSRGTFTHGALRRSSSGLEKGQVGTTQNILIHCADSSSSHDRVGRLESTDESCSRARPEKQPQQLTTHSTSPPHNQTPRESMRRHRIYWRKELI